MSQYKLETPFTAFRGKICKHTEIIYKEMNGTKFTSQICNPRTKPFSAEELARQDKFRQASAATKAIMQDAQKRASAIEALKKQAKYRTLWGYIWAQEYAKL